MQRRVAEILTWLQRNPGWHSYREIGIGALHLDKMSRWGAEAIVGPLKKLRTMGAVEFGRGKLPGVLEAYRAKEK